MERYWGTDLSTVSKIWKWQSIKSAFYCMYVFSRFAVLIFLSNICHCSKSYFIKISPKDHLIQCSMSPSNIIGSFRKLSNEMNLVASCKLTSVYFKLSWAAAHFISDLTEFKIHRYNTEVGNRQGDGRVVI